MSTRLQTQGRTTPLSSFTPVRIGVLQRKCACGNHTIGGGECEACRKNRAEESPAGTTSLQRQPTNRTEPAAVPPIIYDVLRSPGQPLDPVTRAFFEPRFGYDFSRVRVHTDAKGAESARAVDALTYTVGRDIVFGAGQYTPTTLAGRGLLAHELAHVVQRRSSTVGQALSSTDNSEREAELAASAAVPSDILSSLGAAGPVLQRQQQGPASAPSGGPGPASGGPSGGRPVFFCSKAVALGQRHAFFRVGSAAAGNPTFELEHDEYGEHCTCGIQGWPTRDYPEDVTADAQCVPAPMITEACLLRNWATYPIGKYCALGPNSNTYARFLAEKCGASGLRPPGSIPGFDDSPPASGTANPALDARLTFLPGACQTIRCDDDTCRRVYF